MEKPPVYEVRCPHCDTSFAPGTKSCVHCGRRLGGGLIAALGAAGSAGAHGEADEALGTIRPGPLHEADDEAEMTGSGRNPVWILTALFLVVSAVLRACVER